MARIDGRRLLETSDRRHRCLGMEGPVVEISDTFGLWERSLIAWPDGRRDTTTYAGWLQGPALFADLRQPTGAPSFEGVVCLNDLGPAHFGWLARQEGFAGRFVRADAAFEWLRMVDFQSTSGDSDAGFLVFDDEVLVETGRDVPYVEHWHRATRDVAPLFAVRLQERGGRQGFIVRAGSIFMYVRDRAEPLPFKASLADVVGSSPPDKARALLDCEISQGRIESGAWIIERSSLPYRTGQDLAVSFSADRTSIAVADQASDGTAFTRHWAIVDLDVDAPDKTKQGLENDEVASPIVLSATGRAP
jgi:hypothetical protein